MIDIDKYEGHTQGPWDITTWREARQGKARVIPASNMYLFNDAPLLLAEVKRLRKELKDAEDVIRYALEMSSDDDLIRVIKDYLEVVE